MYSNPHAAVGLTCTATTYSITGDYETSLYIGLPLAIVSHWLMDFLREGRLSRKQELMYDIIPSLLFYIPILFLGDFWKWGSFFLLSWIAGNLFDLIDKKIYLAKFKPAKFKPTYYFHKHKKGIQLTTKQTIVSSYLATILVFALSLAIKHFS